MASNQFGNIFRFTTWGESHGKAIGVVIDGCPAGILISANEINLALQARAPGRNAFVSARKEPDQVEILSGVFDDYTTGAPVSIQIKNLDIDSRSYHPTKDLYKPGHANYTYLKKYNRFDYKGSGRSSGRETACRVIAGVFAKKILKIYDIETCAYLKTIGNISFENSKDIVWLKENKIKSIIFCPCLFTSEKMLALLELIRNEGDSIGAVIEFTTNNLPIGLGDPVYEKIEANLAKAMLSIPASKGFEIGEGFNIVNMRGSKANDNLTIDGNKVKFTSNNAGGVIGGITNGMPLIGRVAFKPTSSIFKKQSTLDINNQKKIFEIDKKARHDPCIGIRAVPVVEAMLDVVLADAILMNKNAKYENL
jgi:chorismate synthase